MKTERERKLEAAMQFYARHKTWNAEPYEVAPAIIDAGRNAREALADEDAGGGADHSRDFEGSDPRGMGPLPEEPGNPNPSFEQMENDTPPQQRDECPKCGGLLRHNQCVDSSCGLTTEPHAMTTPQHPDDAAIDRFVKAMKEKLARARDKGRGGWDDPEQCSDSYLATLLVDHLRKGNVGTFEDVANFAMMLHQRGAIPTTLAEAANAVPSVPEAVRGLPERMRKHAQHEDARAAVDGTASDVSFQDRYWADELDRALAQSGEGWQYYYKHRDCPAQYAEDENCICWYREGTGPHPFARHDDPESSFLRLQWRKAQSGEGD